MEPFEKTEVRMEVAADAKKLWRIISSISGVDQWLSGLIRTCEVEGKGVGAKRHCTMSDGTKLHEEIVRIDHERMIFTYKIIDNPSLPATQVQGTMMLKSMGQDKTELTWQAEYLPRGEMPGAMRKMCEEVYPMGIKSLEGHCGIE